MSLPLRVITSDGQELSQPYLIRAAGWTEERYFEEAPETRIVEFEDGEIIMHSPVNIRHQDLVGFLGFLLRGYVRNRQLGQVFTGPAVVRLRPGLVYEPDIFIVAVNQLDRLGEKYFSGAPALVIEVISSGDRNYDLKTKASNYGEHGVPEYWAIDQDRKMLHQHMLPEVSLGSYLVRQHAKGRLQGESVPGFWIEVDWLWEDPLPRDLDCLNLVLAG